MATNTFERKIEIKDNDSLERLSRLMSDKTPSSPISSRPTFRVDTDRSEDLLKRCPLRSQH